ncbi:MAG: DUF885 domain-containing protein, partial [Henriciella sp.]|nr:DUF885 domain-containing protein [Henriciella sp.]
MTSKPLMFAASALTLVLAGCATPEAGAAGETASASVSGEGDILRSVSDFAELNAEGLSWDRYMESFLEGYFELNPTFAVSQGRHEFDGQLPDWSDAGLEAQILFRQFAIELAQEMDEGSLSEADAFERQYLINTMQGEL